MFDFLGHPLQLVRDLLGTLPGRVQSIIVVGLFILGSMGLLVIIRRQVGGEPITMLTRYLVTGIDAALITLLAFVVFLIIAAVVHVIFYRGE